ncbi:ras GEF [Xylona heveae TC161]|uniref:Ras GEF n=1 Tax=Xylona heveae (strain CBS 132557 / TC161) TaxID=1328760 RepID=A0A165IQI6_XYLHT|nr:ras GEF [Xylona heveae TC161]KZF25236.1 ras GEF [Xylona heveae TC161]
MADETQSNCKPWNCHQHAVSLDSKHAQAPKSHVYLQTLGNRQRDLIGNNISSARDTINSRLSSNIARKDGQASLRDSNISPKERRRRARRNSDRDDGCGSSGIRFGKQFTVGNVGHNGMIYLRPVARPMTRGLQLTFARPGTASIPKEKRSPQENSSAHKSNDESARPSWAVKDVERSEQCSSVDHSDCTLDASQPRRIRAQRARSFSTKAEREQVAPESFAFGENQTRKDKNLPREYPLQRPRTADERANRMLEVPIPHYRLGHPSFSTQGNAFMRSSVYTTSSVADDVASFQPCAGKMLGHSTEIPQLHPQQPLHSNGSGAPLRLGLYLDHSRSAERQEELARHMPTSFDDLVLESDHPAVVRYSPNTGNIVAATPLRMIAQITSANFLDYELLSDFFLTFRSFLSTQELANHLTNRLRWAIERHDDLGRIVRVRTFVALRHWILNYFVDDFVPDQALRSLFCDQINKLSTKLRHRSYEGPGDLRIVEELKKCWRRTCSLYWDFSKEPHCAEGDADEFGPILPGGELGNRRGWSKNSDKRHSLALKVGSPSFRTDTILCKSPIKYNESNQAQPFKGHLLPELVPDNTIKPQTGPLDLPLASPGSEEDGPVFSCSGPSTAFKTAHCSLSRAPVARPVHLPSIGSTAFSDTSRAHRRLGKCSGPMHGHKRSFSDALTDPRTTLILGGIDFCPKPPPAAVIPNGGGLVRGNVVSPGTPFVSLRGGTAPVRAQTNIVETRDIVNILPRTERDSGNANPGVKRLVGSVRRALSHRQAGKGPVQSANRSSKAKPLSLGDDSSHLPRNSSGNLQPEVTNSNLFTPSGPYRIDFLTAQAAEAFSATTEGSSHVNDPTDLCKNCAGIPAPSSHRASFTSSHFRHLGDESEYRCQSDLTTSSRSILIVDDINIDETFPPALNQKCGSLSPDHAGGAQRSYDHDENRSGRHELGLSSRNMTAEGGIGFIRSRSSSVDTCVLEDVVNTPDLTAFQGRTSPSIVSDKRSIFIGKRTLSLRRSRSLHSLSEISTVLSASNEFPGSYSDTPQHLSRKMASPALRRRPGGDLRAAHNMQGLRRSRSQSSLSITIHTYSPRNSQQSHSTRVSGGLLKQGSQCQRIRSHSLALIANNDHNTSPSLFETHSSRGAMRKSFEAEVAKLAQLPDDEEDDGGIESTLLKLEGRYQKQPEASSDRNSISIPDVDFSRLAQIVNEKKRSKWDIKDEAVKSAFRLPDSSGSDDRSSLVIQSSSRERAQNPVTCEKDCDQDFGENSVGGPSVYSENSVPLLGRGLSGHSAAHLTKGRQEVNIGPASGWDLDFEGDESQRLSAFRSQPSSPDRLQLAATKLAVPQPGLLNFDTAAISRTGSAMSIPGSIFVWHPLSHPPSPPLSMENAVSKSPKSRKSFLYEKPLTPNSTAKTKTVQGRGSCDEGFHNITPHKNESSTNTNYENISSVHCPFILSYDAKVLAQQFTLIEKDALYEIEWRELVELDWNKQPMRVHDWVDFLRSSDAKGVDLVTGRFNLMVKWVISECLLTRNVNERVLTIIKYINVAAFARKYRNYATMYQITVALVSAEIAKLSKTWEQVPIEEKQTLRELELLVQPFRNFYNLRAEMETVGAEEGCIPFVGLYTHDLIYNAQKPTETKHECGSVLINFERHLTTAAIVKNLLRLIEASSRYNFRPIPTILDKCIWISALSDEDMKIYSNGIE